MSKKLSHGQFTRKCLLWKERRVFSPLVLIWVAFGGELLVWLADLSCCVFLLIFLLPAKIAFCKSWHCILWQRYCKGLTSSSGWRSCQSAHPEQSRTIIWQWKLKFVWNHLCFDTLQVSTRRLLFVLTLFLYF